MRKKGLLLYSSETLAAAEYSIMQEFRQFIELQEDRDFFDPRNRDDYQRSFAAWLMRPREFPSND